MRPLVPIAVCDLCGGATFQPRHDVRDHLLGVPGTYGLKQCATCSLSFLSPRPTPEQIGEFYPPTYAEHQDDRIERLAGWERIQGTPDRTLTLWERLRVFLGENNSYQILPPPRRDASILDVGCASGTFLDKMKLLGWRTAGLEPNPQAAKFARDKGHEVVIGSMEQELAFDDAQFDTVYCWHALEHSHSPTAALAEIRRVLKPGGHFVMAVPNFGGFQARLFGRFWSKMEPPRHLFQFTRPTLRGYLEKAGFDDVEIRTRAGAVSWYRSVRCTVNAVFGTAFRRDPMWLVALFAAPVWLSGLCRYFGAGADLRALCRKA